ncbi:MAG: cyanophycinase [Gemmatimonadota bacterium]|nr:cyanophycinase [Gemmatimonadota bacterium]MDE3172160.1 cyanophycinase [Gemmatimonadota bacterium]MDE3216440.1 cyanophycinase [Gemmatimonadota bacterium]
MTPRAHSRPAPPGLLIPIGGAEAGSREPVTLGRFLYAAGGTRAELAVVPTGSSEPDTGERYRELFTRLGARVVHVVGPTTRREANDPQAEALVRRASGIFITGGDQYRVATVLRGTAVGRAIRAAHAAGAVVGGTSAGAAVLSAQMIAFGKSGATPRAGMVSFAPGLGLTSRFIIDQHFRQRDRLGRLLTALATYPRAIGLGLDEDTAAQIGARSLEVVGSGAITVVDPAGATSSLPRNGSQHQPICITGLTLHVLVHGATFDITTRTAAPPPAA